MEINCQNIIEDQKEYIDFLLQSKEHGRDVRVFVVLIMLIVQVIIIIVLFLIAWILSLGSWKEGLQFSLLGLVLSPIILLALSKLRPVYYYGKRIFEKRLENLSEKEKNIFLLPKKFLITSEDLQVESALAFHKWKWSAIEKILLLPNLVVIYIDKNYTYLIPKRIFKSEDDFLYFYRHLLECKNKSVQ
jgi:hypothetical protein